MKPFNLERALAGDPVVTRSGEKVLGIFYIKLAKDSHKVVALVRDTPNFYHENGRFILLDKTPIDLFMAPMKKEVWVNVYKNIGRGVYVGNCYFDSEEKAIELQNKVNSKNYIKSVKIHEYEE